MKRVILSSILMISSVAFAGGNNNDTNYNNAYGGVGVGLGIGGAATATGGAGGDGGSANSVGIGGTANSISNATGGSSHSSNDGNSQNVNVSGGSGGIHVPHQAPSVFMSAPNPTAVCQASAGGFLSAFIFGGVGMSGTYTLEQCEMRESARIAYSIGQVDMAKEIICMSKYAKKTRACAEYNKDEEN